MISGNALLAYPVTDPGVTEVKILLPGSDEVSLMLHMLLNVVSSATFTHNVPKYLRCMWFCVVAVVWCQQRWCAQRRQDAFTSCDSGDGESVLHYSTHTPYKPHAGDSKHLLPETSPGFYDLFCLSCFICFPDTSVPSWRNSCDEENRLWFLHCWSPATSLHSDCSPGPGGDHPY